ncbi:MAG: hypothetical protein JWP69_1982 [Flaviaesturariibacter sp.]|nr:hypothetical protein [Flaviaesturariibacter sp.]
MYLTFFTQELARKKYRASYFLILTIQIFFIISIQGRAGWVGFIAGLVFLLFKLQLIKLTCKVAFGISAICIVLLVPILFLLKTGSSEGRLLIYKVSATLFQDHWLWGIGIGRFKTQYNLYQADYFTKKSIDDRAALLADNTIYAFNDLWQLLIEIGAVRFAGVAALAIIAIKLVCKHYVIKPERRSLFYGSVAAIICILAASLFSYPFHNFLLQAVFLIYVTTALFALKIKESFKQVGQFFLYMLRGFFPLVIIYLLVQEKTKMDGIIRSKQAFELSQLGYKNKSLKIYDSLFQAGSTDGATMMAYAKQLYFVKDFEAAKRMIRYARMCHTDNNIYSVSAEIEEALKNSKGAERDYKTALYMVPNRMRGRFNLFQFYLRNADTTNAIFWGNSIVNMPIKVPSDHTASMRRQTVEALNRIRLILY